MPINDKDDIVFKAKLRMHSNFYRRAKALSSVMIEIEFDEISTLIHF